MVPYLTLVFQIRLVCYDYHGEVVTVLHSQNLLVELRTV